MAKWERTGYDTIPVPGEPYYPQGKPADEMEGSKTLARGSDSNLVQKANGEVVVTDRNGRRRA